MKYYIIAGEASGDLHGSNLISELIKLDNQAVMRCWGGNKMQAAGASIVKHYKDLAFMGFIEVLFNLKTILNNLKFCKKDITAFKPDVLILIDYPGFNLRIAQWAKQQGLKVIYYISPQIWAWKENRVHIIKNSVHKMLCILPFEKKFYAKWNFTVEYVGHPLVEVVEQAIQNKKPLETDREKRKNLNPVIAPLVAILPGSRKQEIKTKLPIMLKAAKQMPQFRFVLAKAPSLDDSFYEEIFQTVNFEIETTTNTYNLLNHAQAAIVTSGTATLETALFNVPEVVCYKGNAISYQIAKRLIKIKFIALVNLIMNRLVVKELIQNEVTAENLIIELNELLNNHEKKLQLKSDYSNLKNMLSLGGNASKNAAKSIYKFLTI